uniref:Uncharacterized protein n=1 Tax=Ananas comosus var. bracteatus TaxID=296719 RepID=A0A6V7QLP6_ANACO|nr:unnamed protein product [Ananas comosus var. bracteatus]
MGSTADPADFPLGFAPKLTNQIPTIGEILLQPDGTILWGNSNPVMTTPELIAQGSATALKPRLIGEYDPIHNSEDAMFTKRMSRSPMPQHTKCSILKHVMPQGAIPLNCHNVTMSQYHHVL